MSLTTARRRSTNSIHLHASSSRQYSNSPSRSFISRSTTRAFAPQHATRYGCRMLSSTPPSLVAKAKLPLTETPLPPPVRVPNGKKPKVELRPAPVKPKPSDVFPKTPSSAKEHGHRSNHLHSAQASRATTSTTSYNPDIHPHREGVIESAQHDYEAASSHGILAPPPPGAGKIKTLIHQAKEFLKFYWAGLKLINTNRVRANRMRARVAAGGPPLTRWETKFVKTYKEDALKLIPFALIIIIAEEAIPFVVMWAPFLLPSTCILPSQKERIDAKKRSKQQVHAETMKKAFEEILRRGASEKDLKTLLKVEEATAVSGLLGQSPYTFGLNSLRLRRIRQHLAAVSQDDVLLLQEGLGERLTDAELNEALGERGIITDGLTPKQWQSRLKWWLTNVNMAKTASGVNVDPIHERVLLVARSAVGKF